AVIAYGPRHLTRWRERQQAERLSVREHTCATCHYRWFQFDATPAMIALELRRQQRALRFAHRFHLVRQVPGILMTLATYSFYGGDLDRAWAYAEMAAERYRELDNARGLIHADVLRALTQGDRDPVGAVGLLAQVVDRARAEREWAGLASALRGL